jgi:hypothetical protein
MTQVIVYDDMLVKKEYEKLQKLPSDMIIKILSFDKRFVVRNGKVMNRILNIDFKYKILKNIPRKIHYFYNQETVVNFICFMKALAVVDINRN